MTVMVCAVCGVSGQLEASPLGVESIANIHALMNPGHEVLIRHDPDR